MVSEARSASVLKSTRASAAVEIPFLFTVVRIEAVSRNTLSFGRQKLIGTNQSQTGPYYWQNEKKPTHGDCSETSVFTGKERVECNVKNWI